MTQNLIADLERRAHDCQGLLDTYAEADLDNRARLRGKASAYKHAAELVAAALQSAPKPTLPSREESDPYTTGWMRDMHEAGWRLDPVTGKVVKPESPSPLSDRVERLEQALRPFAEIAKYANGKPDALWVGQTPAVIRYRDLDDARAALGDGERE